MLCFVNIAAITVISCDGVVHNHIFINHTQVHLEISEMLVV